MNTTNKNILVIVGLLVALLAVWYFSTIVIYVVLAAMVSLLGLPIAKLYRKLSIGKYKISNGIASLLTLFTFMIFFLLVFSLFIPLVTQEARIISSISTEDVLVSFQEPIARIENYLASFNINSSSGTSIEESIRTSIAPFLSFASLSSFANAFVGTIGDILIGFVSVMFISFYFLKDENMLPDFVLSLTPEKHTAAIKNIILHSRKLLRKYFLAVLVQSLSVSVLVFLGLFFVGVENALIIAFLSGILNIVPYVGPLIAAFIGLIIGVSTNLQLDFYTALLPLSLKIVGVYAAVQFIDNFFLQPFIFSNTVNIHPLEIFIVILLAGTLVGIAGMIIAIPTYSMIRIIAREFFSHFKVIQNLTKNI